MLQDFRYKAFFAHVTMGDFTLDESLLKKVKPVRQVTTPPTITLPSNTVLSCENGCCHTGVISVEPFSIVF